MGHGSWVIIYFFITKMICPMTVVKRSLMRGAGEGLFASHSMRKGETVAGMALPTQLPCKDWEEYCRSHGHPDDSGVYYRKHVVFDLTFTPERRPLWHYMNHSHNPNTVMKYVSSLRGIVWVTRRPVSIGEELTFDYGEPDSAWEDV